jgi:hypothetical protein
MPYFFHKSLRGSQTGRFGRRSQPWRTLSLATNYIALADYADRQHERGTVTRDDKNKRTVKPGANAAIS